MPIIWCPREHRTCSDSHALHRSRCVVAQMPEAGGESIVLGTSLLVWLAGHVFHPSGPGYVPPNLAAYEMHEEALSQIRQALPQECYVAAQARDGENLTVRRERDTGNSATFSQAGEPLRAGRIPDINVPK